MLCSMIHKHTDTRNTRLHTCSAAGDSLPAMCVGIHNSVHKLNQRFLAEQRRHYYVTPTSYLELLGSYKSLLGRRQVCCLLE